MLRLNSKIRSQICQCTQQKRWFVNQFIGNLLRQINNYEEALQYLNQALAIDPKHINTLYTKGQTLREMKLYEEATKCYDQVLKLDPNHTEAKQSKEIIRTAINLKEMYNNMKFIN